MQSDAIIGGSHRPTSADFTSADFTSADFGQRLVGRRPVVGGQCSGSAVGGVKDHHTPSTEARLTLVHRVCGRVDGAVVGVWVAP